VYTIKKNPAPRRQTFLRCPTSIRNEGAMAFSTETSLSRAWRFEDIKPEVAAKALGCAPSKAKREVAAVRARLADRAQVDGVLRALPAPALAVLSLLAEHDGLMLEDDLLARARARFELGRAEVIPAVGALLRHLLVVELGGPWHGHALAMVEPIVEAVLDRVVDLDIAPLPDAVFSPAAEHDGGRALLAACSALHLAPIKRTQSGSAHRSGIKRLAKQLGASDDRLETLVASALAAGLLVWDAEELLRPHPGRLRAAAEGCYDHEPHLAALVAHVRAAGVPIARERVERWLARTARSVHRSELGAAHLDALPGWRAGAVAERAALAVSPPAGSAAATVTPSFEVFLPPESRPIDVVDVLRVAELVRIDRVIVGRISKVAVTRAAAAGVSVDELVAALAGACKTALPQNVETAIRDWASDVVRATIAVGRVVVVPTADEARVAAAFATWSPRLLAPGVVMVPETVPARAVSAVLAKPGIHEATAPAASEPAAARPHLPALGADPALRARLDAYRGGDAEERRRAPQANLDDDGRAPASRRCPDFGEIHGPRDRDDAGDDDEAMISPQMIALVERWEKRCGHRLVDDEFATIAAVLDVLPAHDRSFLLAANGSAELRERLGRVLARGGFESFLARHRDRIEEIVPELAAELVKPVASPKREWLRDGLLARVEAAARTHSTLVLDLGSRTPKVAVSRVVFRGSAVMVLGEDADDQAAVAVPLSSIRAVAEVAPNGPPPPARWRPAQGDRAPPGHVPCPCGSGRRYRACCRAYN
jgi:hypothetical protein